MPSDRGSPPTIGALVLGLARLGLLGFGGVGPQAHYIFVERSGWLSPPEFAELYSLAQALPGANVVNLCAITGDRWFGPYGAAAAVGAITLPPLLVVLVAAAALEHVTRAPRFVAMEAALVAAGAGLILATAYRVFSTIAHARASALVIGGLLALAVGGFAFPMPLSTLVALATAILIFRIVRVGQR